MLERRGSMGFGSGQAMAQGVTSQGGTWLVRGALGKLKFGDEAGASACNRYGCSRALLLRPTENLLHAASPPWWNCKYIYTFTIRFEIVVISSLTSENLNAKNQCIPTILSVLFCKSI